MSRLIGFFLTIVICRFVFNISIQAIEDPIAYWPLDEAVGTTALDYSQHQNHAILEGASWEPGKRGFSLQFDGDDVLYANASSLPTGKDPWTLSIWTFMDDALMSVNPVWFYMWGQNTGGGASAALIGLNELLFFGMWCDVRFSELDLLGWHHIVLTFGSDTLSLYVDGQLHSEHGLSCLNIQPSENIVFGQSASFTCGGGAEGCFQGKMDEIKVFGKQLSASEVINLYNLDEGNSAPYAVTKSYGVKVDTPTDIVLEYNDFDGPGPYTYTITQSPQHGVLTGTAPNLTFIPESSYYGVDSFKWIINDGLLDSYEATATLNMSSSGVGKAYFISPDGQDNNSGLSESAPWATFDRAWQDVGPGDTLILMDGTYYQTLSGKSGQVGNPVTIRALNDGKAIIDGQNSRRPINLVANNVVVEGVVAKNGTGLVIGIQGNNNILRRVTAYNADVDGNSGVILITSNSDNNLLEDVVAAGTGRKMIFTFGSAKNNTIRRSFAFWRQWDGRAWCSIPYPYGANIEIYDGSHNTIENSIGFSFAPTYQIGYKQQNPSPAEASYNRLMGNMAVYTGRKLDGSIIFDPWPTTRPGPTECDWVTGSYGPGSMVGFWIDGQGDMTGNLLQDNLAYGNAQLGLSHYNTNGAHINNQFISNTLLGNGVYNSYHYGSAPADITQGYLDKFDILQDNKIGIVKGGSPHTGGGARLTHRYIDGQLTNEYLWPWPMEERIREEFAVHLKPEHQIDNFSVTCEMGKLINQHTNYPITNIEVDAYCSNTPPPSPTPIPTPSTDLDSDSDTDWLDLGILITNFSQVFDLADFNLSGLVDIFDFNRLLQSV